MSDFSPNVQWIPWPVAQQSGESLPFSARLAEWVEPIARVRFDWPESAWTWAGYGTGLLLACAIVVWMYVRDTRSLGGFWRFWLLGLRLSVVAGLAVIALNPHVRDEETLYRPSRVVVLVDTSLSMRFPAELVPRGSVTPGEEETRSRADALVALAAQTPLIRNLQRRHEVTFYTFDSKLEGPISIFPSDIQRQREAEADEQPLPDQEQQTADGVAPDAAKSDDAETEEGSGESLIAESPSDIDWKAMFERRGHETRLGEALHELIGKVQGETLAGILVVTDGASNAGYDPRTAHDLAVAQKPPVKLFAVGVGSAQKQPNVRIANLQAPTQVHIGDPFEIIAFAAGQEMTGRGVEMELYLQPEGDAEIAPVLVDSQSLTLGEDGVPVEVTFRQNPNLAGRFTYTVQARPIAAVDELREDDNRTTHGVEVVDRQTRVLLMAGGPMREYHFLRNMLYRHSGVRLDVWLQTVDSRDVARVSQESDQVLIAFPATRAELFEYDVIVAFDPDWRRIPQTGIQQLMEWVEQGAGGLVLVAGDIHTEQLAGGPEDLEPIKTLYPVFLRPYLLSVQIDREADQPYPIEFQAEGTNAGFLQLVDDPAASAQLWSKFPGVYRAYPTGDPKAAATVYAYFSNPRAEKAVLMAGQFYGAGRSFYLGSAEMWRLRAQGEEYYDRFWTKVIREVAQGRLKSGASRAALMPEKPVYYLGETIRVRARLLDPQFQPLEIDAVTLDVFDPAGRPLVPARRLVRDPDRPGQFRDQGDIRASLAGTYRFDLTVPDSGLKKAESVQVRLPNLEDDHPEQDANVLNTLVRDTGGRYLRLEEAVAELPELLLYRGTDTTIFEQLRLVWDKSWVMYVLVTLLSLEWLSRKLLKLA